jgi:hypothetical protein
MTIYWPDGSLLVLLAAFVVTFGVSRLITMRIRAGKGRFSDVTLGVLHVHHMVWGVGFVLLSGTVAIAFRPGWPLDVAPAIGFGAGAALVLDEFALILYLRDVYWAREGRLSLAAVTVMGIGVGMIALPLSPSQLPKHSRPVVILIVASYVLFTAVCLAKGKVLTSIVGLFIPPIVVYGGLRLARPNSPWAYVRYRRNPRKLERAEARYRRTRESRRRQFIEILTSLRARELRST